MAVNKYIKENTGTEAIVRSTLDDGFLAFHSDQGFEAVKRRTTLIDYFTSNKHFDTVGSTFTFHDSTWLNLTANTDIFVGNKLTHLSDTDTFIQFDSAEDLIIIQAGGVEFMRFAETTQDKITINNSSIDMDMQTNSLAGGPFFIEGSSGNVGTGTTAPLLNVGTAAGDFSGTGLHIKSASNARMIMEGDIASAIWADTAGAVNDKIIGFQVDAGIGKFFSVNDDLTSRQADILSMDMGSGNVGIGNSTPSELLSVGDDFGSLVSVKAIVIGDTTSGGALVAAKSATNFSFLLFNGVNSETQICHRASGQTQADIFLKDGKVGIIQGSAETPLHVFGDSITEQLTLERVSSSTGKYTLGVVSNTFAIKDKVAALNRITINSSGSVGIGIDSASNTLHVKSTSGFVSRFESTTAAANIRIIDNVGTSAFINVDSTAVSIGGFSGINTKNINIKSTGDVGIGTTSPSALLHIAGDSGTVPSLSASTFFVINNSSVAADSVEMSLIAGTTGTVTYNLGSSSDEDRAFLDFNNSSNLLRLSNPGAMQLAATGTIDLKTGNIRIDTGELTHLLSKGSAQRTTAGVSTIISVAGYTTALIMITTHNDDGVGGIEIGGEITTAFFGFTTTSLFSVTAGGDSFTGVTFTFQITGTNLEVNISSIDVGNTLTVNASIIAGSKWTLS